MNMKCGKNRVVAAMLIMALLMIAVWVAASHGYKRGYAHGEQITNTWWIDKQSRYYDASEVEKKRSARKHNLI